MRDEVRTCAVCSADYTRTVRESDRLWRRRATCGPACAQEFKKQPLGTYPSALLTCVECGSMARPRELDNQNVCPPCNGALPAATILAYAASPAGRAFIRQCRETVTLGVVR